MFLYIILQQKFDFTLIYILYYMLSMYRHCLSLISLTHKSFIVSNVYLEIVIDALVYLRKRKYRGFLNSFKNKFLIAQFNCSNV